MPFVDEILKYKSLSIVGLAKNTGKTECLNYVLRRLESSGQTLALTSIGVDGEMTDRVTGTAKPEIELYKDLIIITSEKHFRQKSINAEILDISTKSTALGRLITARTLSRGKVMLSGPADTLWLKQLIGQMDAYGVTTTIVDGAISRLSPGSPAVTDSMILNTGAAVSANIPNLIRHTMFVHELIKLPVAEFPAGKHYEIGSGMKSSMAGEGGLLELTSGLYAIDAEFNIHDLKIPSVFLLKDPEKKLFDHGNTLYVAGALTDKMLDYIRMQKSLSDITIIVRDFTRIFVKPETFRAFIASGHQIKVLLSTRLLAICVNPVSPEGYVLNSNELCTGLSEALKVPVYDIKKQ